MREIRKLSLRDPLPAPHEWSPRGLIKRKFIGGTFFSITPGIR